MKSKTCTYEGCTYPIWGGGYCKSHQHHRTDKKVKRLSFKVAPLTEEQIALINIDNEFYKMAIDK